MGIGNIGWTEFLVILALALIFFGPRRLPGIAQTLGKTMREFQKALNEVKREVAQADRQASDAKSYVKSILPPPLTDQPASSAPVPEDAESERTAEAAKPADRSQASPPPAPSPQPTAATRETEEEDGDAGDKDVP